MANLYWGKVYYKDEFAGTLRQEPGDSYSFTYDYSYIQSQKPAISFNLPLSDKPHISRTGLHSFFDNLVAEGWLESAQMRLLSKRNASRFELLLAFGLDLAGAVSVIDPEPARLTENYFDEDDPKEIAIYQSRASLSGIQPKLAIVKEGRDFVPAKHNQLSTYIAKFPSANHPDLIENEFLTTKAIKALTPDDNIVEVEIAKIKSFDNEALIIKRFDREGSKDPKRIHFEEFNQLLNLNSNAKYDGSYKQMANFIDENPQCVNAEKYKLFLRILAGILVGNTDMHFKNFAMTNINNSYRLTPNYDQVSAALYQYKTLALEIYNAKDLKILDLKPSLIIKLGEEFNLNKTSIKMAIDSLRANKENALEAIKQQSCGTNKLKDKLTTFIEKRWNKTFDSIGKNL